MKITSKVAMMLALVLTTGCKELGPPVSSSGIKKATVKVPTNPDGLTTEQQNIRERLVQDNAPGAVKHLYVISAYSGQVIIYSTVRGKVTSGGKRLTPTSVTKARENGATGIMYEGFLIDIGGTIAVTGEVLQDDGTYGSSAEYLFWWDTKGIYHQHYVSGGQILHVSSEPLVVKGIIINMQLSGEEPEKSDEEVKTAPVPVP